MSLTKKLSALKFTAIGLIALAVPAFMIGVGKASDHADTPDLAANPGTDISDVFCFPSPTNSNNVVLVMNVHPLIGPGQGSAVSFDPNVLYQFKFDTNGDGVEDKVIQAKFTGTGATQTVSISGPVAPTAPGTTNQVEASSGFSGKINQTFSPTTGMQVFCGAREDPFFFDLEQFFTIFPDRATPITGNPVANPNTPQALTFRAPGVAKDFLSAGHYNVLSIVIELPKGLLQ